MLCYFSFFQRRNKSKTEAWAERFTREFWRWISGRALSKGPRPHCVQEGGGGGGWKPWLHQHSTFHVHVKCFYLTISSMTRNQNSYCAQLCVYMLTKTRDVWTFISMYTSWCFFCVSIVMQFSLFLLLFQKLKSQSCQNCYFESYTILNDLFLLLVFFLISDKVLWLS